MRIHSILPVRDTAPIVSLDVLGTFVGPGTQVTQSVLHDGPAAIESERDIALAVPHVVAAAVAAERSGADAIVINCMADPGLFAARESVRIPVIGPAQAAAATAGVLAERFSVIGTDVRDGPMNRELWRRYGCSEHGASVRIAGVSVLDLLEVDEVAMSKIVDACSGAVREDGAGALVLGCNYMSPLAGAIMRTLAEQGLPGIPVIDPLHNAFRLAELLAAQDLAHSEVTWPPVH